MTIRKLMDEILYDVVATITKHCPTRNTLFYRKIVYNWWTVGNHNGDVQKLLNDFYNRKQETLYHKI